MNNNSNPSFIIKCNNKKQAIISSLDSKKYLGVMNSNKNESRLTLNVCNNDQNDQKWEIRTIFPVANNSYHY